MPAVTDRRSFKNYCLRQLGHPVIAINVDADQLDDCVDNAFQYWQDFHADATERMYVKHQITQDDIDNKWVPIPEEIIGVNRIFNKNDMGGNSRNMFDLQYQMHLNDLSFSTASGQVVDYVMTRSYLSMLDLLFNGQVPVRFNRHTDKLYIDWDWNTDAYVGLWIIIEGTTTLDPADYPDVWNDRMLKALCVQYIKRQWGHNMKKHSGIPMLGGVTLNGQQIYEEAVAEILRLEELIRTTHEEPPMFIMG